MTWWSKAALAQVFNPRAAATPDLALVRVRARGNADAGMGHCGRVVDAVARARVPFSEAGS